MSSNAPNGEGSGASPRSLLPIVIVAAVLLVGLYLILTGDEGQQTGGPVAPTTTTASQGKAGDLAAPGGSPGGRSDATAEAQAAVPAADDADRASRSTDPAELPPEVAAVVGRTSPTFDDMPPEIAEAFRHPYKEITPEMEEKLHRARNPEIPPDILRAFEDAANPDIPPHILRELENPYPPGYDPEHPEDYVPPSS